MKGELLFLLVELEQLELLLELPQGLQLGYICMVSHKL